MLSGEPPAADNPRWMSPPTDERRSGGSARQTVEQARPGGKKAGFRTSPGWRPKPRLFTPWSRVAWTVWPAFSGRLFASRRKGFRPAGRAASSRMNKVYFSFAYRRIRSPHPVAAWHEASACGDGMRRYLSPWSLALSCRPIPQGESMGRQAGARSDKKRRGFFIAGTAVRSGCRGAALTSLFWLHDEGRCYKTHLVQSFGNPFPARAATGWRFVERHIVAVQQNISCPAVGYRCPGVICAEKFRGEGQTNGGSHDGQRTIALPETVATRCGGIREPTSPTGRVRPLTFAGFGRSAEPVM